MNKMKCCGCFKFRKLRPTSVNRKKVTIVVIGLEGAGKSTVIRRLKFDLARPRKRQLADAVKLIEHPVSTIGFSVNTIKQKDCDVSIYELGGRDNFRGIWHEYFATAHGFIYVVDAQDTSKLAESKNVLTETLKHSQVSGKPVLLLANKQDAEGALDEIDLVERLDLEVLVNQQRCPTLVELCSASKNLQKGDLGITNGFKWLLRTIVKDYPMLNNRVLVDLATQEIKQREIMENNRRKVRDKSRQDEGGGKNLMNGVVKSHNSNRPNTPVPVVNKSAASTFSEQFFETTWNSTADLIETLPETPKNFLKRPKSAGPRFSLERKSKIRSILNIKSNKTVPVNNEERPKTSKLPAVFDLPGETEIVPYDYHELSALTVESPKNVDSRTTSENSILTVVEIERVPQSVQSSSPVNVK